MHAMSGNDDYVTSDDDDHAEKKYARPVFIKKSKREAQARSLEGVGHPGDRPVKQTQGHDEEVQKTTIRLVPMAMDRPQSRPKKKRQRTSPTSLGTALFEYGESIAGYKCVTTEGERDRLKQKRERESESESESESEVDVSAFDQAKDTEAEAETERPSASTGAAQSRAGRAATAGHADAGRRQRRPDQRAQRRTVLRDEHPAGGC